MRLFRSKFGGVVCLVVVVVRLGELEVVWFGGLGGKKAYASFLFLFHGGREKVLSVARAESCFRTLFYGEVGCTLRVKWVYP